MEPARHDPQDILKQSHADQKSVDGSVDGGEDDAAARSNQSTTHGGKSLGIFDMLQHFRADHNIVASFGFVNIACQRLANVFRSSNAIL